MKIRPAGAELYADGRTDMTKQIVAFRNFANAPKSMGLERLHVEENRSKTLCAPDLWNIVASKSGTVDKVQKNSFNQTVLMCIHGYQY